MVDGSQVCSDPTESRVNDSFANIRRRLQILRSSTEKKIQYSNSTLSSSKSQIDLNDEVRSREMETKDTRYHTIEPKLDQSTMKPSTSSRRKQKVVNLIRSRSSIQAPQQRMASVPSLSSNSTSKPHPFPADERRNDDGLAPTNSLLEEAERKCHQEVPRPAQQQQKQKQKQEFNSRTAFHVRLSIGYMTGLKIDKIAKRNKQQPSNNRITVGFVELASSGRYTALSQPLLTNVEEKAKTMKILWANQRGGEEISKSKSRRRLHFSLLLEKESNTYDARDDNNDDSTLCSNSTHVPEVVKLLVGLKCGDERIPLGIAKIVVNGRETNEQKMDLRLHPVNGLTTGTKTKRGIFGKKQRCSFTNGDLAYKLASNAALRVKADIKTCYPGQDGGEIWGNDEASYTTKWTFDAGRAVPPHISPKTRKVVMQTPTTPTANEGDIYSRFRIHTKENTQTNDKIDHSLDTNIFISPSRRQERLLHQAPVEHVSIDEANDMMSFVSGMTNTGYDKSWSCAPLCCGEEFDYNMYSKNRYPGLFPGSFSFDSSQVTDDDDVLVHNFDSELETFNSSTEGDSWTVLTKKLLSGNGNKIRINKYRRRPSNRLEKTRKTKGTTDKNDTD
ncbi:MAG: hypothetical protein ACI90V_012014 [Bacillariaceae sp.]|jgi:hypothetical protein